MSREMLLYVAGLMLRSTAIAALAGLVTVRMRNVAKRHAVWLAVVVATLVMPVADVLLPAALIPAPVQQLPALNLFEAAPAVVLAPSEWGTGPVIVPPVEGRFWPLAAILYMCVSGVMLFRLGIAYRNVSRLTRSSRPVAVPDLVAVAASHRLSLLPLVRESSSLRVPMTVGFVDPSVIVPSDWTEWDEWKLQAVLSHELAHIRRWDWATTVIASLNRCVFWFNPLSWWIERHLSILSEKASDEASIRITGDAVRYAEVLLQFAAAAQTGQRLHAGGVAMARKNMRSRIDRVLTMHRPGQGILSLAGWLLLLVLATPVLYTAAALHVAPESLIVPPAILMLVPQPVPVIEPEAPVPQPVAFVPVAKKQPTAIVPETAQVQPRLISQVKPVYPSLAKQARIQGIVILSVTVGTDGRVTEAQVMNGHPLFHQAAIDAVKQWVYEPQAAPVVTTTIVNFSFQERPAGLQDGNLNINAVGAGTVNEPTNTPGRIRVAGLKPSYRVEPKYPEQAKDGRIQGAVALDVVVGSDGVVKEIRVNFGHPLLQQAAIDAVSKWRFEVPMIGGETTEVVSTVVVNVMSSSPLPNPGPFPVAIKPSESSLPGGTFTFRSSDGRSGATVQVLSMLQRCNCTFNQYQDGSALVKIVDVSVRLVTDSEMEVMCHAAECVVTSVLPNDSVFVQTLTTGRGGIVSTSARVSVIFSR